jgi:hypothetical protein
MVAKQSMRARYLKMCRVVSECDAEISRRGARICNLTDDLVIARKEIDALRADVASERNWISKVIKENARLRWCLELAYAAAERSKDKKPQAPGLGANAPMSGVPSRGNQRSGAYPVREYDI